MGLWVVERPAAVWDANKKIQSLWKIKSVLPIKSLARKHELGNGRITLEDLDFFSLCFVWGVFIEYYRRLIWTCFYSELI